MAPKPPHQPPQSPAAQLRGRGGAKRLSIACCLPHDACRCRHPPSARRTSLTRLRDIKPRRLELSLSHTSLMCALLPLVPQDQASVLVASFVEMVYYKVVVALVLMLSHVIAVPLAPAAVPINRTALGGVNSSQCFDCDCCLCTCGLCPCPSGPGGIINYCPDGCHA